MGSFALLFKMKCQDKENQWKILMFFLKIFCIFLLVITLKIIFKSLNYR
jgi:hypothetical protein